MYYLYVSGATDNEAGTSKEYADVEEAIKAFRKEMDEGKEYASLEFLKRDK